uniref:Transposase n=1 Tax=Heterorhabditis bacteriophora TaxID=37862 RepID=A0A1I7WD57_HETBA
MQSQDSRSKRSPAFDRLCHGRRALTSLIKRIRAKMRSYFHPNREPTHTTSIPSTSTHGWPCRWRTKIICTISLPCTWMRYSEISLIITRESCRPYIEIENGLLRHIAGVNERQLDGKDHPILLETSLTPMLPPGPLRIIDEHLWVWHMTRMKRLQKEWCTSPRLSRPR